MRRQLLERIREVALALPDVTERLSAGAPCFFVSDRAPICRFHDGDVTGDGRTSIWCPAPVGVRDELVTTEPDRFFAPTPSASGVFGDWIGCYLDGDAEPGVDWDEVAAIIEVAYRLRASKRQIARLDERSPPS